MSTIGSSRGILDEKQLDDADLWPSKRRTGVLAKICMVPLLLILLPLYLVFVVVAMVMLMLFTVTGIGPLLHYYFSRRERHLVDRDKLMTAHHQGVAADADVASPPHTLLNAHHRSVLRTRM